MYECMYLRISVSLYLCISVSLHLSISVSLYLCISVSMYLCIYVSMYLCMYVSMNLCIHVPMYLCIYVSMSLCIYVCVYVWMRCSHFGSSFHDRNFDYLATWCGYLGIGPVCCLGGGGPCAHTAPHTLARHPLPPFPIFLQLVAPQLLDLTAAPGLQQAIWT